MNEVIQLQLKVLVETAVRPVRAIDYVYATIRVKN